MSTYPKGDEKKRQFLTTAMELFLEKGYEKTTIQDIIDKMEVSKGAFYHYFESKEDIIVGIAEEYAKKFSAIFEAIPENVSLSPVEKINKMIELVQMQKSKNETQRSQIKSILIAEENCKLQQKIFKAVKKDATQTLTKIIKQGIHSGDFQADHPEELADFFLFAGHHMNESIDDLLLQLSEKAIDFKDFAHLLEEKISFYEMLFAQMLHLKKGAIKLRESYLKRFLGT